MKKILFVLVVLVVLVFGLTFIGCPEKEEDQKVVAEEYRGVFIYNTNGVTSENSIFKYTENRVFSWDLILVDNTFIKGWYDSGAAWTVGADLYTGNGHKDGTFTDVNTLKRSFSDGQVWTYTRTTEYP